MAALTGTPTFGHLLADVWPTRARVGGLTFNVGGRGGPVGEVPNEGEDWGVTTSAGCKICGSMGAEDNVTNARYIDGFTKTKRRNSNEVPSTKEIDSGN